MGGEAASESKTLSQQISETTSYANSFNETFSQIFNLSDVASTKVNLGASDGGNMTLLIVLAGFIGFFVLFRK